MTRTRQVLLFIVVIFILYAIYTSPTKSADAVHAVWNVITTAIASIFRFFDAMINRR